MTKTVISRVLDEMSSLELEIFIENDISVLTNLCVSLLLVKFAAFSIQISLIVRIIKKDQQKGYSKRKLLLDKIGNRAV